MRSSATVDVVVLALSSAALFGAMTVALQPALQRERDAFLGAFLTVLPACVLTLVVAMVRGGWEVGELWPFFVAGVLGPGMSQVLFTLGVRDAGPSRTSVTVGTAPLFSGAFAIVLLGEPVVGGLVLGAVFVVGGGLLLVGERGRPAHVKTVGLVYALAAAIVFSARDIFVRWLSGEVSVDPLPAAAVTTTAGAITILVFLLVTRRPVSLRQLPLFAPAGVLFGLSYLCLFEAFFRGKVTVVSPLVATESLWGVGFSALFLHRTEVVGRRLVVGAVLIVAGGVLIGLSR